MPCLGRRFAFPALLAVLYCLLAVSVFAQKRSYLNQPRLPVTTPQSVEGGMWRMDGAFDSTLHLKNVLINQSLQATPSLVMADGTIVHLPAVTLAPAGVASVNITDAINHLSGDQASHRSQYGMALVDYAWSWPGAIMASIHNIDETAMLSFHSSLQTDRKDTLIASQKSKSQAIESIWWKPYAQTTLFVFLGNAADNRRDVKLTLESETGSTLASKSYSLAPHQSMRIDAFQLLKQQPEVGASGSISIQVSGPDRSLVAVGGLQDLTNGFSANLHLFEDHPELANDSSVHSITIATSRRHVWPCPC